MAMMGLRLEVSAYIFFLILIPVLSLYFSLRLSIDLIFGWE